MNTSEQVDILSPGFKANPFPLLARLRSAQPVHHTTLPDKTQVWLLTRYEDVYMLLKDERFAKCRSNAMTVEQLRKQPWVPPMFRPLERTMLDLDLPDHTRLRGLVHKAFTPRLIEQDHRRVKQRVYPMLGFKKFENAAITISGIELIHKIRKGQFDTSEMNLKERRAEEVWEAVLAT